MITDTKAGQTNYCPNCEDQARRIEELERQNKALIDAINSRTVVGWLRNGYSFIALPEKATSFDTPVFTIDLAKMAVAIPELKEVE